VTPTHLARGQRVGGRYRLEQELGVGDEGTTWEAVDERLDRPVALRIFESSLDRKTIVRRAGRAASLTHPRVVRVFDTGEDGGNFFTVSELVSESLQTTRLPLAPDAALDIAIDVAEAIAYAHDRGVVHGHLHEGNILLAEGGAKVSDFALAGEHADKDDDLRSLGALIRRVSRVPDPAAPPGFSRVIEALAAGAYQSAFEALTELRQLQPPPPEPRSPRGVVRHRGRRVAIVAILLAIVAFGVMRLGGPNPQGRLIPGGKVEGTPLAILGEKDLDPEGDDKVENPDIVDNATDGDPTTFWSTVTYRGSRDFSGLKSGVGIYVDVGDDKEVAFAQVLFASEGCGFELRSSDDKAAPVSEWPVVKEVPEAPVSATIEFGATKARYWLVWITSLAPSANTFRCSIKEIDLFGPDATLVSP
jgi:serine/threonine protein kinase